MMGRVVLAIAVAVFVAGARAHAGVDTGNLCKEAKAKAAGKKAADVLEAFGKNEKRPHVRKLAFDISKARSKFTKGFTKAEDKAAGACPTSGDSDAIEAKADAFVDDVIKEVAPRGFVDNGDGTITDRSTRLMWEKKDDNNAGGIHDVDNYYTWSTVSSWDPDGTAFTSVQFVVAPD